METPIRSNTTRGFDAFAERAEEREELAYELFSHIMGDVPWDHHVTILKSIYTELADYILTRFVRVDGGEVGEQHHDSEPGHSPNEKPSDLRP